MVSAARRRAWNLGLRAETLGTWVLRLKGYRIPIHFFVVAHISLNRVSENFPIVCEGIWFLLGYGIRGEMENF